MREAGLAVPAALALVLLAGCATPDSPEPAVPGAVPPVESLNLTGCTGVAGSTPLLPDAASPARPPAGWEPKPTGTSAVGVMAFRCERIGWGAFERGPVGLVADLHGRFAAPERCLAGLEPGAGPRLLVRLVVDDAGLADALVREFGLPAEPGAVAVGQTSSGALTRTTWTWSVAGGPSSELAFDSEDGDASAAPVRLLWTTGEDAGVGAMDLTPSQASLPSVGAGHMAEPMLGAKMAGGAFLGGVSPWPTQSLEARVRLYDDLRCEHPA